MKKTIIYIFGPRRLADTYYSNKLMALNQGGWLKIGKTDKHRDNVESKEIALSRIREESHTGIPEVCQIYDAFEYPRQYCKIDDIVRRILTDEIYNLESSKMHNSSVNYEKYEVKAGNEFVYDVKRSQVLNAIAKFEHNLILQNYGTECFDALMQCIKNNAQNAELDLSTEEDLNGICSENSKWIESLWHDIKSKITEHIHTNINIPPGRAYFFIYSSTLKNIMKYVVSYSVRYKLAFVGIETFEGEEGKTIITNKIENNPENHPIKNIEATQGVKCKDKWAWSISTTIDKSKDDLIKWYIDTILSLYRFFEKS